MNFICFNGRFLSSAEAVFTSQNRSFKWGDGFFETMKVFEGKILMEAFHFDRLFLTLQLLQMDAGDFLQQTSLTENILALCKKNNYTSLAKIRLAVYRNEENKAEYIIEAWPLSVEVMKWNEEGLKIDIYPYARKTIDAFANLKTANFLPYVMAAKFAKEKKLDDALVLNAANNICDSSKANIFLIKGDEIYTPALHQGCINGVMRRFLLQRLKESGQHIHQEEITENDLLHADEVFLTNAIQGIRWVQFFKQKQYTHTKTFSIYQQFISTI